MKTATLFHSLVLIFAFSSFAYAADQLPATPFTNSEHLHQAEAGSWEVTPQAATAINRLTPRNSPANITESISPFLVTGEYGFNDMFSVGILIGYETTSATVGNCTGNCSVKTINGMTDPQIYGKFKADLGPGTVKAILNLDFTLGNATLDSNEKANGFSGGNDANLALAYESGMGAGLLGVKVSYDVWKGDAKTTVSPANQSSYTQTVSGGASFDVDVYYEYKLRKTLTLGAVVNYTMTPDSTTSTDTQPSSANNSKQNIAGLGIYVPILVGNTITLYPEFDYGHSFADPAGPLNDFDIYALSFKARFVF